MKRLRNISSPTNRTRIEKYVKELSDLETKCRLFHAIRLMCVKLVFTDLYVWPTNCDGLEGILTNIAGGDVYFVREDMSGHKNKL